MSERASPVPPAACLGAPGAQLVIISGPSGVGKDTIIRVLRDNHPDAERHYVITCTTRGRRDGEVDGVDYHFIGHDAFLALREHGALLESAEVHGNWYGTPKDQVAEALTAGRDAILKIDVQGARTVREQVRDTLSIFIVPPSLDTLFGRLHARATERPEELERRKRDAETELARQTDYDYVVVNETGMVARTASRIDQILLRERALHPDRRISF